jgi:hypothetical protein
LLSQPYLNGEQQCNTPTHGVVLHADDVVASYDSNLYSLHTDFMCKLVTHTLNHGFLTVVSTGDRQTTEALLQKLADEWENGLLCIIWPAMVR